MRIYYLSYTHEEGGSIESFSSKREARARLNQILKEYKAHDKHLEDGSYSSCGCNRYHFVLERVCETELPISAKGVLAAFQLGSEVVSK
jgi:hypothetical protein